MPFKHGHVNVGEVWKLVPRDGSDVEVKVDKKVEGLGLLTFDLLDSSGKRTIVTEADGGNTLGGWSLEPITAGAAAPTGEILYQWPAGRRS